MRKTALGCTILEGHDIADLPLVSENSEILEAEINKKVDKVSGKGLSTNDYTTVEKNKLAGIETGANKYVHPNTHPATMITTSDGKNVETKLAEVFQSGLDGKNLLETSIKSKGGTVSKQGTVATFNELDLGIKSMETGDYSIGDILSIDRLEFALSEIISKEIRSTGIPELISVSPNGKYLVVYIERTIQLWNIGTGSRLYDSIWTHAIGVVAMDDGSFFVGTDSSISRCNSSGQVWSKTISGTINSMAVRQASNIPYIYVGTNSGIVHRIQPTGAITWSKPESGSNRSIKFMSTNRQLDNGVRIFTEDRLLKVMNTDGTVTSSTPFGANRDYRFLFENEYGTVNIAWLENGGETYTIRKYGFDLSLIWTFTWDSKTSIELYDSDIDINGNIYSLINDELMVISPTGKIKYVLKTSNNRLVSVEWNKPNFIHFININRKWTKNSEGYQIIR